MGLKRWHETPWHLRVLFGNRLAEYNPKQGGVKQDSCLGASAPSGLQSSDGIATLGWHWVSGSAKSKHPT